MNQSPKPAYVQLRDEALVLEIGDVVGERTVAVVPLKREFITAGSWVARFEIGSARKTSATSANMNIAACRAAAHKLLEIADKAEKHLTTRPEAEAPQWVSRVGNKRVAP